MVRNDAVKMFKKERDNLKNNFQNILGKIGLTSYL